MACGGCGSSQTYTLQFIEKHKHNPTTYSFDFAPIESIDWREGDSVKVFIPVDGVMEGKKFSFVTLPDEKLVRFTTRISPMRSRYKEAWHQLKPGDFIDVSGPGGGFWLRRGDRPALLISSGVGIAAARSLVKAFEMNPTGVNKLTQINIDRRHRLYEDEFNKIQAEGKGFRSVYTHSREDFYKALDYEAQRLMLATGYIPYFYVVGSDEFVLDVSGHLTWSGFDDSDIITDGVSASGGGCGCSSGGGCGSGCSCA